MSRSVPMRVLILTAGCDPTDVGEAWSSFQWVKRLAEKHDITLLTYRKRNRSSAVEHLPHARVVEWLDLPLMARCDRFNSMIKPGYLRFYRLARRWIQGALRRGEHFDLVHQLSPLAIRYPSPAVNCGVPFIIGPLGGSIETPLGFASEAVHGRWYTRLRGLDRWRLRHDPWLRSTLTAAEAVIGVAPYVREVLGGIPIRRFETMSETGVVALPEETQMRFNDPAKIRLLYVGRVIRSKGVRDAVAAMAQLRDLPGVTLDVIGDGDDRPECQHRAATLGVSDRTRFHGQVSRDQLQKYYIQSDAFLFPSFREPSGNVVLEAMSHGLAMVVAASGGPGSVVTDECGYRISPLTPEQYTRDLAGAIRDMAHHPARARLMGNAARQRIRENYLWDRKVQWMDNLYRDVVSAESLRTTVAGVCA